MTIQKGTFKAKLKIQLSELCEVNLLMPIGWLESLALVPLQSMIQMLDNSPKERGKPRYASIQGGYLLVFPATDKRYRIKVLGTQYVEQ